jgi:iron complex transport system substrate-binding protein
MRKLTGVLLMLALALVACGSPSATTVPSGAAPTAMSAASNRPAATTSEDAPQLPASVTDKDAQAITITSIERIVSLNGDITEIIFALGLGQYVVGVDTSATYPPEEVKQRSNIGYQRRLNAEGILALQPTLVIGSASAGPPEAIEQIRAAGVPVALTTDQPTLESPLQKIRFVGQALGMPQRGAALAGQVEAEIAAATARLASASSPKPHVLFLYLRGTDVQQVGGANTAADAMIVAAGGINAAAEAGIVDFKPLSPEAVVAARPDVLLLLDAGLESVGGIDGLLEIQGLADTPAGAQRRIVALDDLYLLGMGPRTGQALGDLVTAFHPEAKP